MTAGDVPVPGPTVVCAQCGEPYRQMGRGNGGWFHFMVVAAHPQPDGRTRIAGHWRAGDWIEGAPLVLRARDGHGVTVDGAEMEPPLNSACEARGQRTLIVSELSRLAPGGCLHAAR
jgi:hypothetical protein